MGSDQAIPRLHPVGKVVAVHGLRGWVRVCCLSDFPERLTQPGPRWIRRGRSEPTVVHLESGQYYPSKNLYLVKFAHLADRTQAESWIGAQILVSDLDRPQLNEDEYYLPDLIGSEVIHQPTGKLIGHLRAIVPSGHDVLEVETQSGEIALIPFVKAIVPVVDLDQHRLEVTPPPGLLETFMRWDLP